MRLLEYTTIIMFKSSSIKIYVVHYSKLIDRKTYLTQVFSKNLISVDWVTEKDINSLERPAKERNKVLGVSDKKLGMDLGVASRSLIVSRRRARFQGHILYWRSFFSKNNSHTTGSLPPKKTLPNSWLEVQSMHLKALRRGVASKSDWILILEDDAVPSEDAFMQIQKILLTITAKNSWISLNSGASLVRTSSDPKPDSNGLFKVKPATTRCAVSYLVSGDLAARMIDLVDKLGVPRWLPIDVVYQALLRKTNAQSYWQEPPVFEQGSESGKYTSAFDLLRNPTKYSY